MRCSSKSALLPLSLAAIMGLTALPADAKCTRLGFSVNDYGKDGPTRDAKDLLDKHIAKWAAENKIAKYQTGKKDVSCELFLNFIVFDEHTCRAEATVCFNEPAGGLKQQDASLTGTSKKPANTDPAKTAKSAVRTLEPKAAKPAVPATTAALPTAAPAATSVAPAAPVAAPALPPEAVPAAAPAAAEKAASAAAPAAVEKAASATVTAVAPAAPEAATTK